MKKILIIYPTMMLGGSTTALLSLLNNLDPCKYDIDLQLFRNKGPLLTDIPQYVTILPESEIHTGIVGRVVKILKFIFTGFFFKSILMGIKHKKIEFDRATLLEFQSKILSRKNNLNYDYAIGFLEGWSDWYLAFGVKSQKKYAWLHSTYANITPYPESELPWMNKVDKIVFVTEKCRVNFSEVLPSMEKRSMVIENITDSSLIKRRSEIIDKTDKALMHFAEADCFKLITVCRLSIQTKGLDRIVKCAQLLKNMRKNFLWYIVGEGEDEERLCDLIKEYDVEDCLFPIGKRLNPYPFIKHADVMCMPSRYEGKPLSITESMILGVPPIVTEYLSAHAQINSGINGIVVPNTDEAILETLLECIEEESIIANMKRNLLCQDCGNVGYIKEIEELLFE